MITEALLLTVLVSSGVPKNDAKTLVCIAQHESSMEETKISKINTNDTRDYGLFQINSIWVGICIASDRDILNPNNNIRCALYVYEKQGLTAWSTYKHCKGIIHHVKKH